MGTVGTCEGGGNGSYLKKQQQMTAEAILALLAGATSVQEMLLKVHSC